MCIKIIYIFILIIIFYFTNYLLKQNEQNEHYLNQKQIKFKQTLEDMANILNNNNIFFFLYCGTALGPTREKTFIEHDQDIDIGVFEDIDLKKITQIILNSGLFKLQAFYPKCNKINKNTTELAFLHIETNVKIDVFQVLKQNNDYIHYSYNSICNQKLNKRCEFKNKFNMTTIYFFNKKYNIPNEDFLISHYGNDWNIIKKFSYEEGLKKNGYKSINN